jgi:hypothetical protein
MRKERKCRERIRRLEGMRLDSGELEDYTRMIGWRRGHGIVQ